MMLEKLDNCPDCSKELSQAEYDGQHCDHCKTTMGFFSAICNYIAGWAP